jgi:hypothetical protein
MTNLTKFVIASFLTASVSTAALAQTAAEVDTTEPEAGAQIETQTETGVDTGAATGTGAAAGAQADATAYGDVIASLRASGDAEADIEAIEEAGWARIVTLAELRGGAAEQAGALDEALSQHEDKAEDIRSAVENNDELKDALEARGLEADDVVAVVTDQNGEVTLVVDADA